MSTRSNKTQADSGEIIQSGKWNASKDYTTYMIFAPLYACYQYERVARFGTSEITEDFQVDEKSRVQFRINAIYRLLFELKEVIINSEFSLKNTAGKNKKTDRTKARERLRDLEFIEEKLIDNVQTKKQKGDKYETYIDENKFNKVLKMLQKIRREVSGYVDNAELIYFQKEPELTNEEMDELIWKEAVEEG